MSMLRKIGLISDTHGSLPQTVLSIFKDMDLIVHAGDIGSHTVIRNLEKLAPVTAVRGNCDFGLVASFFDDLERFVLLGREIAVMHRLTQAQPLINKGFKGIIIFGHTHNPEQFSKDGVLFINPGSPSLPRNNEHGTVAVLAVNENDAPLVTFYKTD